MVTASSIVALLEYQKIDAQLVKIERDISSNEYKNKMNASQSEFKEVQAIAMDLEEQAGKAVEEFNEVKAIYEDNYKKAQKLTSLNVDTLSDEELEKVNSELDVILGNLNGIEKRLILLNKNVESILTRFEESKQTAIKAKTIYTDSKTKYETFLAQSEANTKQVLTVLNTKKAGQDKELFVKYHQLRQENIFPVIVPIESNHCRGCGVSVSGASISKLNLNGICDCENCRRILYKTK